MQATVTAYAKINLLLDVLNKRADGYHEVAMIMQGVSLSDKIVIKPWQRNWLQTNNSYIPVNMNNLAMKAVTFMQKHFPQVPPLHGSLEKSIPVSAG